MTAVAGNKAKAFIQCFRRGSFQAASSGGGGGGGAALICNEVGRCAPRSDVARRLVGAKPVATASALAHSAVLIIVAAARRLRLLRRGPVAVEISRAALLQRSLQR